MKKVLLFLTVSILLTKLSFAQLTYVPDDNFEQALIDLGYDSGALDDYVPTVNIESVTNLDVSGKNISDLTGIEDFLALEGLFCTENLLTSLDVAQNLSLLTLHCGLNQLNSLDVTQNVSLTSLVFSFNEITNIDVSQNLELTGLFCLWNQLTEMDVTNNTNLEFLYCTNNLITNIDVSQNSHLQGLRVDDNQLATLDVSQNSELYIIDCNDNQLTHVNLINGNNLNITNDKYDSSNNPNLACIFVDDAAYSTTNWTEIDPSSTFVETEAECDLLATNHFKESNFTIYPNPTQSTLTIETNTHVNTIEIYTVLGQKMLESASKIVDISQLNSGMYVLIIEDEFNKTIVKRFVKQ